MSNGKYRMGQKVIVDKARRTDPSTAPIGIIIGIEKYRPETYLSYRSLKHYVDTHTAYQYKVAYEYSDRAHSEWYYENQLDPITRGKK